MPLVLYAVGVALVICGVVTNVPAASLSFALLIATTACVVVSLTIAVVIGAEAGWRLNTAIVGRLFATGFWRGSRGFRPIFVLLCVLAALTFCAGAAVLPRGTSIERVGGRYFQVESGQRAEISAGEAQYLTTARDVLLPVGGTLIFCVFSAGLLRGAVVWQQHSVPGLRRPR